MSRPQGVLHFEIFVCFDFLKMESVPVVKIALKRLCHIFFFSFYKCFPNCYFQPVLISSIFSHTCYFLRLFPCLSCVYPLCKTPCNWVKLYFNERKCWSIQVKLQISLCNPCEDVIMRCEFGLKLSVYLQFCSMTTRGWRNCRIAWWMASQMG